MCSAKLAGIRKFKTTKGEILVGCTQIPSSRQKYCKEHLNAVPSIPTSILPGPVKKQMNIAGKDAPQVLNFAGLVDKRTYRCKLQYKVKWEGSNEESWLDQKLIPDFMKTYFEQTNSHDLPKPKIQKTLKIRGSEEIQLFWTSNDGTEEYHPSAEIVNPDEYRGVDSNCNTKKARGSRLMRYSAGIFLGLWNSYLNS